MKGRRPDARAVEQLYARHFGALGDIQYEVGPFDVKPGDAGQLLVRGRYRVRAAPVAAGVAPLDAAGGIRWLLRPEAGTLRIASLDYDGGPATARAAGPPARGASGDPPVQAAVAPPASVAPPPGPPVARDELLALIERFRAAYERKDLDAVMGLFGAEPRERNVSGRINVQRLYARNFAALDGIRYELSDLEVVPGTDGHARGPRPVPDPRGAGRRSDPACGHAGGDPLACPPGIRWSAHQRDRLRGRVHEVAARSAELEEAQLHAPW